MNRNDFLNLLESNLPVSNRVIGEVYELISIFPYFQSAHMLLLKTLHNNADVKFENQLRDSAIHISDREVLYWLLNPPSLPRQAERKPVNEIPQKEEFTFNTQQTVIESAGNSNQMIEEIEKESGETIAGKGQSNNDNSHGHQVMIASEPEGQDPAEVIVLVDEKDSRQEENVVFMDPGFSLPDQSDLLELDLDADIDENKAQQEIVPIHQDDHSAKERRQKQSDLIDKFISTNPRIVPQREKSSLPVEDIAKPFTEETGGLVTETLAKIYITQGYYSKAIDIFEKLSLKFPEKSSYFAAQIEKVKEYLKS